MWTKVSELVNEREREKESERMKERKIYTNMHREFMFRINGIVSVFCSLQNDRS